MSFTNIDLVKKHIREHALGTTNIENISCRLLGQTPFQLPHTKLLQNSEKVKGKEQTVPIQEEVSFSSSDTVSLGKIYVENIDYSIDYDDGTITRSPDGSIPPGSDVVVWYLYFRIYAKDTDYRIDYDKGQITRTVSGAIEDGQRVLADYTAEFGLLSDEVMANAMVEANDKILKIIDPSYSNSMDQSLVTAETYLAVSILCNIKTLEVMTQTGATGNAGSVARSLSLAWSNMSSVYRERAFELLKKFRKDPGGLCSPYAARSAE
jgi:hypothetical protein